MACVDLVRCEIRRGFRQDAGLVVEGLMQGLPLLLLVGEGGWFQELGRLERYPIGIFGFLAYAAENLKRGGNWG